jgi:sterol desaturase/sphingolipid hydroxylase (fatty acid hydroxylase superfamily)
MGLLTTEHSKSGYLADFIVYGIASITLAALLAIAAPRERWLEIMSSALLGLMAWTIVEYGLHRFVLHGLQPFRSWHVEHHRRPRALMGTPTVLSAMLIAALVFLPALLLGDLWLACALTFGLLTGYLIYAVVHHATHHWRAGSEWTRRRKLAHALHHSPVGPRGHYGVTSAFWDGVFGTSGNGDAAAAAGRNAAQVGVWENEGGALAGRRPSADLSLGGHSRVDHMPSHRRP